MESRYMVQLDTNSPIWLKNFDYKIKQQKKSKIFKIKN